METKKRGRPANLKRIESTEEAREKGRLGGIKSGEVRKEKRLLSQVYGDILAEKFRVETDDGEIELSGYDLIKDTIRRVLARSDAPAVSMIKELREGTEGSKLALSGELLTSYMTPEERAARIAELEKKRAKRK
jgi:hypothetical protein